MEMEYPSFSGEEKLLVPASVELYKYKYIVTLSSDWTIDESQFSSFSSWDQMSKCP